MSRWRSGLHITIGAALFVLLAISLVQNSPRAALNAQPGAQAQQEEPAQGQDNRLFIPFVEVDDSALQAEQDSPDAQQQPVEPTLTPEPTSTSNVAPPDDRPIYNYADDTRGKVINLAGVDVQLPEDGYVEGIIVSGMPVPGRKVIPPLVVVCRDSSCAAVEHATGRIFLGNPLDIVRQDLDFLIQALGEDKIVPRITEERTHTQQ